MLRETTIESGRVAGVCGTDARITVYKGVPFAADTSGANRWRPPQPVEPWEGTRLCCEFGPIPTQKTPGADPEAFYSKEWHVDPEVPMGEDCLRANIWTPAKSTDEKLPVMVWIFGGGLQEGYPHEMEFDGERIASRGVILVSIGYRLNAFGFLCHPELTKECPEAPANFGLLDQNAGIAWVKRNIKAFGGDPDNITIFGQSAGGGSTMYHMTSPKSAGLFQHAIAQSAGGLKMTYPTPFMPVAITMEEAEKRGEYFVKEVLGCSSIEEARKLDADFIEKKYHETKTQLTATIDGKFIIDDWYKMVLDGKINDAQLMTGNTSDEFPVQIPDGDVEAWIKKEFGPYADEYLEIVKREAGPNASKEELCKAARVISFEVQAHTMAEAFAKHGRPLYYYHFGPTIPGDNAGAFHSSELWFTFETLIRCWRPFDGHHFDLARKMCNYWTNFAKTGDPNGCDHGEKMPQWDKYTKENPCIITFGDEVSVSTKCSEKQDFLRKINQDVYGI